MADDLVIARSKDGRSFSEAKAFEELFKIVQETLPVREVYVVSEGVNGILLKEVGSFAVTFVQKGETVKAPRLEPPPSVETPAPAPLRAPAKPAQRPRRVKRATPAPAPAPVTEPAESRNVDAPEGAIALRTGRLSVDGFIPATPESEAECSMFGKVPH